MGRRSINTTKSGKYMNPTDQARKEARKKELKKNKKQRQMVRAAVLKNKDPSQILEEMEKIDEMEYNVLQPSPLNEKVLRDKRKKLKETFDRVMRLYHNDEPEHWAELKRKEVEYEKKRIKKQQYYESVKHAQSVQIDEIPLPAPVTPAAPGPTPSVAPVGPGFGVGVGMRVPPPPIALALPPYAPGAPPGVPKNSDAVPIEVQPEKPIDEEDMDWLGVPPGPPPDLFAMSELDSDAEGNTDHDGEGDEIEDEDKEEASEPIAQNIDDFMKEMEHVHKRKHRKLVAKADDSADGGSADEDDDEPHAMSVRSHEDSDSDNKSNLSSDSDDEPDDDDDDDDEDEDMGEQPTKMEPIKPPNVPAITTPAPPKAPTLPPLPLPPSSSVPAPPQVPQLPPIHNIGPPAIMYRPPPMRPPNPHAGPGFGLRMPPGPPPGSRPPHALGPMPRMGIRMPPGPPPGLPPRMAHHNKQGGPPAPPPPKESAKGVTTITAKPQIRNLSADVTRFVPSTLRVKRDDQRRVTRPKHTGAGDTGHAPSESHSKPPTKDDAYMQFMNEMQGLL
ncbi:WW domain-binding protein 11 [Drosophila subobscura]|uniref:WW domain-binding protein 11 n=1 Tax=Drosophila subobscura TaxID=7241 RepID=UPI00155AF34E|nr:WW domain-binding protein 11 [Drosophila subobscura]